MNEIGSRGDRLDLLIRQGATLGPFDCVATDENDLPIDLTGAVISGKIRKDYASLESVPLVFAINDPLAGGFNFSLGSVATAAMVCGESLADPASRYVWDAEILWTNGNTTPLFYGVAKVSPEATK